MGAGRVAAVGMVLSLTVLGACDTLAPEEAGLAEAALEPAAGGRQGAPAQVVAAVAEPQSVVVSNDPPQLLQFTSSLNSSQRQVLDTALMDEVAASRGSPRATAAEFDLDADGVPEQFIILKSDGWCGSGDVCNVWMFRQAGDGWQAISDGDDAAACVSVLPTATNGSRDVRVHGQCATQECGFDLHFDGSMYQWDGERLCEDLPDPVPAN